MLDFHQRVDTGISLTSSRHIRHARLQCTSHTVQRLQRLQNMPLLSSNKLCKDCLKRDSVRVQKTSTLGHADAFQDQGFGSTEVMVTWVHLAVIKISVLAIDEQKGYLIAYINARARGRRHHLCTCEIERRSWRRR